MCIFYRVPATDKWLARSSKKKKRGGNTKLVSHRNHKNASWWLPPSWQLSVEGGQRSESAPLTRFRSMRFIKILYLNIASNTPLLPHAEEHNGEIEGVPLVYRPIRLKHISRYDHLMPVHFLNFHPQTLAGSSTFFRQEGLSDKAERPRGWCSHLHHLRLVLWTLPSRRVA